ncbi:MAG: O-antigen ligase family protein [Oscillospiraceae bacterium]|nr:O-antigen ligase family protein [Oscillospiraceae bacterium]
MENLTTGKNVNKYWPWIHAFGFFVLFAMQMTQYYYCNFYAIWFPNRYAAVTCLFVILYYAVRRFRDGHETNILTSYAVWVLITRIINGYFFDEDDLLFTVGMFICVLAMALPFQFERRNRQAVFNVFTGVFFGVITFVSAVGIYAALVQRSIDIRFLGKTLNAAVFWHDDGIFRLRIADAHANTGACWAFLGMTLAANRFFAAKKMWLKTVLAVAAAIDFIAMCLTNCRTMFAAFSICFAVFIFILADRKPVKYNNKKRVLAFVLSLVIISPLAYKSIDWTLKGVNAVSNIICSEYLSDAETANTENTDGDTTLFENSRDVLGEGSTLRPRILIWKSAVITIRQQPERLLIGSSEARLSEVSDASEGINFHVYHYHNMFLNTLMLTGVPGLVIVLAFLYILIRKILLLLFSRKEEASLAEKTLVIPLIGLIGYGATLEVLLFTETDIRAFAFFFIAGILLAECRDFEIGKRDSDNGD